MYDLWIYTKWFREWEELCGIQEAINLIPLAKINSLTEDEKALLLYTLNVLYPSKLIGEITLNIVPYYKKEALASILSNIARPQIKEEKIPIFNSLMDKLFS